MTSEGTKERLLAIALEEFAAHGLSGARVDTIAERAGVNVRMIYYWFGSKRELYEAVSAHAVREGHVDLDAVTSAALSADPVLALFGRKRSDAQFARVLQWEELEQDEGELVNQEVREAQAARRIELIRRAQTDGLLPAELDPALLQFALHSLTRAPYAFPGLVRLATGNGPEHEGFAESYRLLLTQLGSVLRRSAGETA